MNAVYKYTLEIGEINFVYMYGGVILHVDNQLGSKNVSMWVLVDTSTLSRFRKFYVAMTGEDLGDKGVDFLDYIGTVLLDDGAFVGHVFEITEDED